MSKSLHELIEFSKELKLLYVEDNKTSREQTIDILKIFFNDIIVGVDGLDAIKKYDENQIDFIITDINMPKIDGLEFITHIRETNRDIPIFILSAYSDTSYFLDSISLSVDGYIIKPIKSEQFIEQIRKEVHKIYMQKELKQYHENLETKVQEQLEELRAKDKMLIQQTKLATMGEMMDIVAHQWKQPISSISMHTSLIYELSEDGVIDKETINKCYEKVTAQVKHMVKTLDDFRVFFRPNHKMEIIKLSTLIDSVLLLLHDDLMKNNINVKIDIPKDIIINVNGSEIKHIFINLLNNARDAFNENKIKEKRIKIKSYLEEEKIFIDTTDNAGGIPKDIIKNIFNSNFTTKEKSGGTGMGLYMSKFIAKKNGAKIDAINIDGGVCFRLIFNR